MILIAALAVVVVGGGAFYAGTKVGEGRASQNQAALFQQRGMGQRGELPGVDRTPQAGQRSFEGLGGGTVGTIEGIEGDSLVVSTGEGTIRVQTTDTTLIEKSMTVHVGDLEIGEQVGVSGSRNDDGSLTARSIRSMQGFGFLQPEQP